MIYVASASLFVALLGWVSGFIYFRKQRASQGRNKLVAAPSIQQLIQSSGTLTNSLAVSYQGSEVKDPHVVVLNLENLGPRDIASSDFDQDKPLRVSLGRPIIATGDENAPDGLTVVILDDQLMIGPALLVVGARHTISLVVDGNPEPSITSSILNCDVLQDDSDDRLGMKATVPKVMATFFALTALSVAAATSIFLLNGSEERDRSAEELRRGFIDATQQYEQTIANQKEAMDEQTKLIDSLLREIKSQISASSSVPVG